MDKHFNIYLRELKSWNEKFNLTSITADCDIRTKHFEDSKTLSAAYDFSKGSPHVIDIGTGAGFPGIPLKIAFPNIHLTLVDSVKKKTDFLKHVADVLDLKDIRILLGRAEDLAARHRQAFDVAICRALAELRVAAELCLPFVKIGGALIAMKSDATDKEIGKAEEAIKILGGEIGKITRVKLPGGDIFRKLVVISKLFDTPLKYPRKAGIPRKRPL